jgi:CubicO group peptidase (beta-lactamase class C family)
MKARSAFVLWACVSLSHAGAVGSASLKSQIDSIVAPYVAAADFMGVVAVQRDGEQALILPYGLASVELDVPHRSTDVFAIGSVSKQFTAVAILLLEQEGRLRTDDPVSKYLPAFAGGEQITIEQLLTHTSGVADIYSLERFGETAGQGGTFAEVIDDLSEMERTHPPGSAYAYSNGGYAVLAAIIERASGVTYGEYLDRRIFKPLGMSNSAHDEPGPAAANRVPGYDPWGHDKLTPAALISAAFSTGAGSIWSSAADLLTWTSALHGGQLLSDAAYEKFTRDYGYAYGYGVSVFRRFGRDVIGHDGRVAGYASDVARYLEDRVTVVILSNVQSVARDEIRRLVAAATFGESYSVPRQRRFLDRPSTALAELVGVYSFGPGFNVTTTESNGRLLARANEGGDSELIPLSETEWFSRTLYATVRFGRDDSGLVDRLIWGLGEGAPIGRQIR